VAVSGCSSTGSADGKRPINNTEKGALIGAVGSGLAGAAVGGGGALHRRIGPSPTDVVVRRVPR
jgi:hypothetical protein